MAADAAGARTDRVLLLALAGLGLVLAVVLLSAWLTVRQPPMEPVSVPSVARA